MNYEDFMTGLVRRNPGEHEFHQAVGEVAMSVIPFIKDNPKYGDACILERMTEPDRIITFRVCWEDDQHNVRGQSRLSGSVQQCHRTLQRWASLR